nr:MAG TPA: hypothetical protein [Caudoviricetes sp.]
MRHLLSIKKYIINTVTCQVKKVIFLVKKHLTSYFYSGILLVT